MHKLKDKIAKSIILLALVLITLIVSVALIYQMLTAKNNTLKTSNEILSQIEDVIRSNEQRKDDAQQEYQVKSFSKAFAIATMIDNSPEVLEPLKALTEKRDEIIEKKKDFFELLDASEKYVYYRLKNIAEMIEVEEIHILYPYEDKSNAVILIGTDPSYYGYTLDDGAQLQYFKDMLTDKSGEPRYQDVTPSTVTGKMMQYSTVWTGDRSYMIEIGILPSAIQNMMKNYELSYIFSLNRIGDDTLYAIDKTTGVIMGSTNDDGSDKTEMYSFEVGLPDLSEKAENELFTVEINGEEYYCSYRTVGTNYIVRMVNKGDVYKDILMIELILFVGVVLLSGIIIASGLLLTDRLVIKNIDKINNNLRGITQGNLDEYVDTRNCLEFSELSDHINAMVQSLISNTDTISYVLNQSEMSIGVYEYNDLMKHVRCTENLASVLHLNNTDMFRITNDTALFKEFMQKIFANRVDNLGQSGVYCLETPDEPGEKRRYIKIEETAHNNGVLGVALDVTDSILERRRIEKERDIDVLTGLYNRRAFERRMDALFSNYRDLGDGLLVMFDADGLKYVNDHYGHDNGDLYLKEMSEVIKQYLGEYSVGGRIGGDEFILFIYHLENEDAVKSVVDKISRHQNETHVELTTGEKIRLRFSFGYIRSKGYSDYRVLEKVADENMYKNKRDRKKQS